MQTSGRILLATACTSALVCALGVAQPAAAQGLSADDAAAMKAQIEALKAQIAALEQKLEDAQAKDGGTPPPQPKSTGGDAPAPAPPAIKEPPKAAKAVEASAPQISFKGAPEISTKDGWSFKPRGRIHYDSGFISTPGDFESPNLGFNSRVRRIRLGAEGDMPGGFGYKVEVDFANAGTGFGDAFLSYQGTDSPVLVRIGNMDTLSGLEQITSSNNSSFIERAAFNDAFLNSRRLGTAIALTDKKSGLSAEAGLFAAHSIDSSFDNDGWIAAARLTWSPTWRGGQMHLGLNYQYRDFASNAGGIASTGVNMPSVNQLARYRSRPNSQLTDVRFIDTGSFAARRDRIVGAEIAGIFGPVYVAGEAQWVRAEAYAPGSIASGQNLFAGGNSAVTPARDPAFFGGYAELGYFFTGETRAYRPGEGIWGRTKVRKPLGKGGPGAWQIAARFDYVDLNDAALQAAPTTNFTTGTTSLANANARLGRGGTQSSYLLALNWYPLDYVRFMLNYGHVALTGGPSAILVNPGAVTPVNQRDYALDLFALRMQLEF